MTNLPAHLRAKLYAAYAVAGVILGAIQTGLAAAESGQPVWLTVALAVYAFLGGSIGYVAQANTPIGKRRADGQ